MWWLGMREKVSLLPSQLASSKLILKCKMCLNCGLYFYIWKRSWFVHFQNILNLFRVRLFSVFGFSSYEIIAIHIFFYFKRFKWKSLKLTSKTYYFLPVLCCWFPEKYLLQRAKISSWNFVDGLPRDCEPPSLLSAGILWVITSLC